MTDWMWIKGMAATLVFEKDALHTYAAFVIQVAAATLAGGSLRHWRPWLIVLGFALLNESLDILLGEEARIKAWQVQGAVHDLVNTMVLPSALLLLCRYRPGLFSSGYLREPNATDHPDPRS